MDGQGFMHGEPPRLVAPLGGGKPRGAHGAWLSCMQVQTQTLNSHTHTHTHHPLYHSHLLSHISSELTDCVVYTSSAHTHTP